MLRKTQKLIIAIYLPLFLVGITSLQYPDLTCVSESGRMELETICLSSCAETSDGCSDEKDHKEIKFEKDSNSCYDVDIDSSLLSIRNNKLKSQPIFEKSYTNEQTKLDNSQLVSDNFLNKNRVYPVSNYFNIIILASVQLLC